ncbi:MAG: mechanosensitive ion channel family protein [Chroococcales cyanobacterium]
MSVETNVSIYTQLVEQAESCDRKLIHNLMFKVRFSSLTLVSSIAITSWFASPGKAQIPLIPNLNLPGIPRQTQSANEQIIYGCVRLDGRCLIKVTDNQKSDLTSRITEIETRLRDISRLYLQNPRAKLEVFAEQEGNLPNIYVKVGEIQPIRLMTITRSDARAEGVELETRALQAQGEIERGLKRAKQERQQEFLVDQSIKAATMAVLVLGISLALYRWEKRLRRTKEQLVIPELSENQAISTQLTQQQQFNLKEVQHRLFQLAQTLVIGGGTLYILGLFPYTRILQVILVTGIRIPLRVILVAAGTYVMTRLSYAITDRFTAILASNYLVTPETNQRMQLRVSTISGVTKGIITVIWVSAGILVALSAVGLDIAPLLAGAGIIGFAVSLASQNLIKDALNGFFIILEDQYAIGDVITVGDIGGLVENINLRITQLRDPEGKLITIPNSEIKIVGNLSSSWSRADLNIPVAYHADVDQAIALINSVATGMSQELDWREKILETPQMLGVDNFGDRGLIVRVWIKTQPLKQWEVAREFRRRLKIAFDQAGMLLPVLQQEIWFNESSKHLRQNGNGKSSPSRTDVLYNKGQGVED